MPKEPDTVPNPRRVEAGRRNRRKRRGLTAEGRQRLRESALKHKPWRFTTGPRTPEGKTKVALNGQKRQVGDISVRDLRQELGETNQALADLAAIRRQIEDNDGNDF